MARYIDRDRVAELGEMFREMEQIKRGEINLSAETVADLKDILWNVPMTNDGLLIRGNKNGR